MLEIVDLYAGYGRLKVLNKVNIILKSGELVALIGPNGAGKSTVLKSIFSIADVASGRILLNGKDITHLRTHEVIRRGISYVSQGRINFSSLTVQENLEIGAELLVDKSRMQQSLARVYGKFPVLKEKKDRLAFTLSGGQQQMLAIGRALMQTPSVLLLDEPSLGLSPKLQKELFSIIRKLQKEGIAILIVEQNAKKAIAMADQTYLLEDGKVVLKGGKEIFSDKKIGQVYLGGRY